MNKNTICVHGQNHKHDATGALSFPIYQSATFAHPGVGLSTGYDYSRLQNPTREHLEHLIATLELGVDAMACSSGMAAVALVMELFLPNDHIIVSEDLYGGSHRLFEHLKQTKNLSFDFINTSSLDKIQSAIQPHTKAIFIETPSNPMMHVTDIAATAQLAKQYGLLFIVDNTFLTPYFQQPIPLGADLVIHSGTKYLGGHNDTLAGFLIAGNGLLADKLRHIYKTTGTCLAPFDSWLIIRGIKTLGIRLEKQQENALKIAKWLKKHGKINSVYYVGLKEHLNYTLSCQQASGFGGMISFEVDCAQTAKNLLERVKIIRYAESLGGVETLITYPILQTHADVPEDEREAKGINECLIRLSVGIEYVEDLIKDLSQALD